MAKKGKKSRLALFLLVIALVLVGYLLYQSVNRPPNTPLFEVINFAGQVEVYENESRQWRPAKRGENVGSLNKIRTYGRSDVDFKIPEKAVFRLNEKSQIWGSKRDIFQIGQSNSNSIYLGRGSLLVYVDRNMKDEFMSISTPIYDIHAPAGSMFRININSESHDQEVWLGVLKGQVLVKSKLLMKDETYVVKPLQKTSAQQGAPLLPPVPVTREEWDDMRDGYELADRLSPAAQVQENLAKEAGTLFQYVIDQGTFYTPRIGFATREYLKDPNSGEVLLEVDYDVFPKGSFVGMYIKTRDLDLSRFSGISFDMRRASDEGFPESVKIEIKTKSGVIKSVRPHTFKKKWQTYSFDMDFKVPTNITEVTLVFEHDRVGEYKKGVLQLSNLHLTPRS